MLPTGICSWPNISLPTLQDKASQILQRSNYFKSMLESFKADAMDDVLSKKRVASFTQRLNKATDSYVRTCALMSERESLSNLAEEIYKLSTVSTDHPVEMIEYFSAKRTMLQAGYNLALSQNKSTKYEKDAQTNNLLYQKQRRSNHIQLTKLTEMYKQDMHDIAHRKRQSNQHSIAISEKLCKETFEQSKSNLVNCLIRFARLSQHSTTLYEDACIKVKEQQEQFDVARKICDDLFHKHATKFDNEKYKLVKKEHYDVGGAACVKCSKWFWKSKALVDHGNLCKGAPTMDAAITPGSTEKEKRQSLTEEDVADNFIHQSTGQYRSIADGVPHYLNPETGYYKYGIRKCSMCNQMKDKCHFTKEEEGKRANKRACYSCMSFI